MEVIILAAVGMTALAIIGLRIRRRLQELTQDSPEKCNGCSHCSDCCLERGTQDFNAMK